MFVSKLQFFSIAIVGENKLLNSKEIEAAPYEAQQLYDGELSSIVQPLKATTTGLDNKTQEHTINSSATIVARWLPMGEGNRITAPDVRRGEFVALYKYADSDKYFWTTLKEDIRLRKLETVIWAFSATKDEAAPTSEDSCYFVEISTHNKRIRLHTTMQNEEPFTYDIEINTKDGKMIITDNIDNYILLDSAAKRIRLENCSNSYIDIIDTSIHGESSESITWTTKKLTINASESYVLSTPDSTVNANTAKTVGSSLTHNGVNVGDTHVHDGIYPGPAKTQGPQ